MTTLNELAAADVTDVFLAEDGFREQIVFTPASGSARTVWAIVAHQPCEIMRDQNHEVEHNVIRVDARRHATLGIIPEKGSTVVWESKTYSWVGYYQNDANMPAMKFSCPTYLNAGHQRGFGH